MYKLCPQGSVYLYASIGVYDHLQSQHLVESMPLLGREIVQGFWRHFGIGAEDRLLVPLEVFYTLPPVIQCLKLPLCLLTRLVELF